MRGVVKRLAIVFLCAACTACADASGGTSSFVSEVPFNSIPGEDWDISSRIPGEPAKPPSGYMNYCHRNPADCRGERNAPASVIYSGKVAAEIREVNYVVNKALHPADDITHYGRAEFWTIPIDGAGDCEDYVLAKRKMLFLLGIPRSATRIAVALTQSRERHAVLIIVTDRGDYVLDNLRNDILLKYDTPYSWIERQDSNSVTGWIAMN
jgi:predicted transglutaminase-like cysteine proteinase